MMSQTQQSPLSAGQPRVETDRLVLAPFSELHLTGEYVSWLNDPEVVRYSQLRYQRHTMESCKTYLSDIRECGDLFYAILERGKGFAHIGNITAILDRNNGLAELSILIGEKRVWGKGYGFEAWTNMMRELFARHKVRKVTAGTPEANVGMLKIMKRANMIEEGRLRRHRIYDSQVHDVIRMAKFAEDE